MTNRLLQTVLVVLLSGLNAWAQQPLSSEALDVRNRLENEIQKNLTSLISTRLDPSTFNVAVRAQVSPLQPPKKAEPPKPETLPAGMDVGTIDVREVISSYEKKVEELRAGLDDKREKKENQFQLSSLEVVVGLHHSYEDAYVTTFGTWLQQKMKRDYGSIAKSSVNKIEPKKETPQPEQKKDAPAEPKEETPFDQFKTFLPMIATLVGAFILAMGMILLGRGLKTGLQQVATAQKPLSLEPKGEWTLAGQLGGKTDESTENLPTLPEASRPARALSVEELFAKIAFICLEINAKLPELIRVWIDSGDEGYLKTALLVDAIVSARERIMSETGALAPLRIPLDEEFAQNHEESMAEAYRSIATLPEQEKLDQLEKIYWDLLSVRTLGLQSLRRPFDFLQSMPKENVMEIMQTQRQDARALALVYMPTETQKEILSTFDEEEKSTLIKDVLANSQVSQRQIWDLDTSVKVATINQAAQPSEKLVNLFPRAIEVLQSLSQVSEIKILRRIAPSLPQEGLVLKQQYATLSFVDEWAPEYIRKLTQVATADELLNLIRQIPQAKDLILAECPPKLKTIIEDDLGISATVDEAATNAKLKSLRGKWNRVLVAENIPMARVLGRKSGRSEVTNAA